MIKSIPALLTVALLAAVAHAADEALPRDDKNEYGRLDNGVQYIIRHNANPPGRVLYYLHVRTGALNESDAQNGLAHFLEHMAFNGSKHFPPGKLLPLLGSLGMTFGADTNAHTNLWETLYKLNLPDTQPKHLELAAKIFADYAGGLNLSNEEIDNERKVILEESRSRKSAAQRLNRESMKRLFAGTRLAEHDIIGNEDLIKTFPPDQFRDYYDAWYRPENMTLIVVGDVKVDDVLPSAKQWLGAVTARTPAKASQTAGLKPSSETRALVLTDPEQITGRVEISTIGPGRPAVTTFEAYRHDVLLDMAAGIVNRRLRNLVSAGKAPFREAIVDAGTFLTEATTAQAEAEGEPADWPKMLTTLITEVDRGIAHGFTAGEVKLIERGLIADAEQAVVAEGTADSTAVIDRLAAAIGTDRPLLSAAQRLVLLKKITSTATGNDLNTVFNQAFQTRDVDYTVTLPPASAERTVPTEAEVLATARAAWPLGAASPAVTDADAVDGLLAAAPTPGTVATQDVDPDLEIATVTFANGVVLHHKFSDYKKDQVAVSIMLPGGQIEETGANHGVSDLASVIFEHPATTRFTSTQINDSLTGKTVALTGGIGRDALGLRLVTNHKDLPTGLELVYALLTDGRLEQAAVDDWKKATRQEIAANDVQPRGQLQRAVAKTVFGGDVRFAPLTVAEVDRLQTSDAEAWARRIAGSAAVEIAVVGDIGLDDAVTLVGKYLGALPKRQQGFDALDALRKVDRPVGPYSASVDFKSVTPQAFSIAGFIAPDDTSPDRRPLVLAAEVLTTRMINRIRQKEQLVYSIGARSQPGHGLPGTGLFTAGAPTDPTNAVKLADTVSEMMKAFADTGPTDEELVTAKKQVMTEITTAMREPSWWLTQIAELNYRKRPLSDLKNLPGVFDTFTADDVRRVTAKYLRPETTFRFVIVPRIASGATTKTATPATKPAA